MAEDPASNSTITEAIVRHPLRSPGRQAATTTPPKRGSDEDAKTEDPVLLDVVRLVDKISAKKRSTRNTQGQAAAAVASSLGLAASVAVIIITIISHDVRGPDLPPLCDSSDCLRFAFLVGQTMDRAADACAAFGSFVCSSAGQRLDAPPWVPAREMLVYRWTTSLFSSLSAAEDNTEPKNLTRYMQALKNPRAMLRLCVEAISDSAASKRNVRSLRKFLEQRKLSWPGDHQREDVHPLDVLLELAISWQMPVWFDVDVTSTSSLAYALRIDFSAGYNRWWRPVSPADHASPSTSSDPGGSAIGNSSSSPFPLASGAEYNGGGYGYKADPDAYQLDSYVFGTLSQLADDRSAKLEPRLLMLSEIHALTPHLQDTQWLQFLKGHMTTAMNITEKTQLLVADHTILTAVDHFFSKFSHKELLAHLSRSVVNEFTNLFAQPGPTSSPEGGMLNDSTLDATAAARFRCQLQVQDSYRLLLAANHAWRLALAANWESALSMLNEALRAAVSTLIKHSHHATGDAQRKARVEGVIKRLQTVRIQMWPENHLLTKSPYELQRLYANFPNVSDATLGTGNGHGGGGAPSYLKHLLESRRALRSWLGTAAYREHGAIGPKSHHTFARYDPFANTVSIGLGVLEEPLFYALGTKAINYGGVVAAFARTLITAIEVDNIRLDAKAGSWSFLHEIRTNDTEDAVIAERKALGITYDAYIGNVTFDPSGTGDQRVVSLEEFSAKQILFISYCYSLCQLSPFEGRQLCTAVVKDVYHFEKAFGCASKQAVA